MEQLELEALFAGCSRSSGAGTRNVGSCFAGLKVWGCHQLNRLKPKSTPQDVSLCHGVEPASEIGGYKERREGPTPAVGPLAIGGGFQPFFAAGEAAKQTASVLRYEGRGGGPSCVTGRPKWPWTLSGMAGTVPRFGGVSASRFTARGPQRVRATPIP